MASAVVITVTTTAALLWAKGSAAAPTPSAARAGAAGAVVTVQADHLHDGTAGEAIAPPLTRAWSHRLPGPVGFPVVVGRRVYVATVGPVDEVTAYRLSTGRRIWTRTLSHDFYLTIGYGSGRLFALTGGCDLLALDPATGDTRWAFKAYANADGTCPAPPEARNGVVVLQGGYPVNRLHALAARTGQKLWAHQLGTAGDGPPVLTRHRILVTGPDNTWSFGYHGRVQWHRRCCGQSSAGGGVPSLHRGRLYVRIDGGVLRVTSGKRVGTLPSLQPLAFSGGTAYSVQDNALDAIDLAAGSAAWSFPLGDAGGAPPLVSGQHVYVLSQAGTLFALRRDTGQEVWHDQLPAQTGNESVFRYVGLAATQRRLLVASDDLLVVYRHR